MDLEKGIEVVINPFASGRYLSFHHNKRILPGVWVGSTWIHQSCCWNISLRSIFIGIFRIGVSNFKAESRVLDACDQDSSEGGEEFKAEPDNVSVQLW